MATIDRYDCITRNRQDAGELGCGNLKSNLGPFALGDIDVNTGHPLWLSIAVVRNELARLDPADIFTANNSILRDIFAPPFTENLVSQSLYSSTVLSVYRCLPSAKWDFSRPFGQTMKRRVTFRDAYLFRVEIIPVGADEDRLSC